MKDNPYPGTREFGTDEKELFFGRRDEIDILAGLVLARRASLLFAQSGAGKSSLINAGLVPELTRREEIGRGRRRRSVQKMSVLPVAGVGGGIPSRLGRPLANVYAFSALHSLFPEAEPDDLAGRRLAEGIAPLVEEVGGDGQVPVLVVFDQFEELFTHHGERWRERLAFFEQVAEALEQHPGLHVLFSMREDFIAELTPFAGLLPGGLRDRFRLERLRPEPALEAVRRPAERSGCPFAEGVAEELIDNLRRAQAGRRKDARPSAAGAGEPRLGEYVEPVHLQIVCRQLWENLAEDRTSIEAGDLRQLGDVDEALRGFYEHGLGSVLERTEVREHRLRDWFEKTNLITPARTRGLVYRGVEETEGLPNVAVDELVDTYLIRSTQRGTDTWYELAHDRLVEPILAANRQWRASHLKPVTVAAEAWEAADRDPRKLYSGVQLADALAAAKARPGEYSELELEFMEASTKAERAAARWRRRQLVTAIGVASVLAIAAAVSIWLYFRADRARKDLEKKEGELRIALSETEEQKNVAEEEKRRAQQTLARLHLKDALRLIDRGERRQALAYLAGALNLDPANSVVKELAVDQLFRVTNLIAAEPLRHARPVYSASFSSDGQRVVTTSVDGTAHLWDASTGQPVGEPMRHRDCVNTASFSPDSQRVVTASWDKTARLWDASTGELVGELMRHEGGVMSASFSPDGQRLVTASDDHTARLWDASTGQTVGQPMRHEDSVNSASFSPNGQLVVTASGDHTARLWDASTGQTVGKPMWYEDAILSASFSPNGQRVVTASCDKTVRLWDPSTSQTVGEPMRHDDPVISASFSPDGQRVLTTSDDHTARLWDASTGQLVGQPMRNHNLFSASFSPDGLRVVTAYFKTAYLWDVSTGQPVGEAMRHTDGVSSASFSPDGQLVVTASYDTTARLWDTSTGQTVGQPMRHGGDVNSASFSLDGLRVVTASDDHTARVLDVLIGPADEAADLAKLAEVVGGYTVTELRNLQPIPPKKRRDRLAELRRVGERAPDQEATSASFIRWYFTPRFERTISPLSKMTVEEYICRMLELGTEEARQEAERNFPGHPLLTRTAEPCAARQEP